MSAKNLPQVAFTFNQVDVHFDDKRLINLTEMWRAAGSEASKNPKDWRRGSGSKFIAHISVTYDGRISPVIRTDRGKGATTWAHWQIALAYAKYLSHEFHQYVNEAFREWAEEKANPGLKMERAIDGYLERGKTERWIESRFQGMTARKSLTSTMKDHNCQPNGRQNPYAEATRSITLAATGKTPREIRGEREVAKNGLTRDAMSEEELILIRLGEIRSEREIKQTAADGNDECLTCVRKASKAIRVAREAILGPPSCN